MTYRARYTISFLPSDTDLINHLNEMKENTTVSMYVRGLIRRDFYGENTSLNTDDIVDKVIQKLKNNKEHSFIDQASDSQLKISEEQKSLITNLF
jgi:glucan phosphoethanolaminetransferase (alkaline phosphatase superfamily)